MVSLRFASAFAVATLSAMVSADTLKPSSTVITYTVAPTRVTVNAMQTIGCFNSSAPLEDHGVYKSQSRGNCQFICAWLNKNVMAVSDGTNCWCGDELPAADSKVSDSSCNTVCGGFGGDTCGGPGLLWVQTTGQTLNKVPNYIPPVSSTATPSQEPVAQSTEAPSTVIQTQTNTPSSTPVTGGSGGSNKVAIAVGVVIGVVVLLAVIGGVFFFLRHKRRREVEEEFRRQANINSFAAGGKLHTSNSSMTDSRLDPEFMARRASNGSIADNEDYSRRILKVTNA